jgi:DNA-binding transcriptional LysR family regulator
MGVNYRYIEAFLSVSREGSFRKAAQKLKIAPSAVSRQIKLLEESVGSELILRSTGKIMLTDLGNILFARFSLIDDWYEKEIHYRRQATWLGCSQTVFESYLMPIFERHRKELLAFDLDISIIHDHQKLLKYLEENEIDIVITDQNVNSSLVTSFHAFEEIQCVVSQKPIDLKKIQEQTYVVYNWSKSFWSRFPPSKNQFIEVNSFNGCLELVRKGFGVAIVPMSKSQELKGLWTKALPDSQRSLFVNTLSYKKPPAHLAQILKMLRKRGS